MRFGMDFGGTNLKAGVFDEDGRTLLFRMRPLKEFTSSSTFLQDVVAFAREVIGDRVVRAGGLAIKGMVDVENGVVRDDIGAGSLLAGLTLRQEFSSHLQIPFAVENDARAYAWGEWRFGAGKGARTMVCMTFGTGIGCAVVAHGSPYTGRDELGGLLGGHLSIDRNGPECPCGHRGCLELYCSATALHHRIIAAHPDCGTGPSDALVSFFSGIRAQRPEYRPTFDAIVDDFATGIVNVVHAYSPDVVVLGGGVLKSADLLLPALKILVPKRAWTFPRGSVRILASALGDSAAAVGVAFHQRLDPS
jgi:glucokinase